LAHTYAQTLSGLHMYVHSCLFVFDTTFGYVIFFNQTFQLFSDESDENDEVQDEENDVGFQFHFLQSSWFQDFFFDKLTAW